jgi:hypothetical protein
MSGAFWQCSGAVGTSHGGVLSGLGSGGFLFYGLDEGTYISRPGTIDLITAQVPSNARATAMAVGITGHSGGEPCEITIAGGQTGNFQLPSITVAEGDIIRAYLTGDPELFAFPLFAVSAISMRFTAADLTMTCSTFTTNTGTGFQIFTPTTGKFVALVGQIDPRTEELTTTFHPGCGGHPGTLTYARVSVVFNGHDGDTIITGRVDGSDTPIVITVPAGGSGWFFDKTNAVTLTGLQRVNWKVDLTGTSGTLTIRSLHIDYLTADGTWTGGLGQINRSAFANATLDLAIGGLNSQGGPQLLPQGGTILAMGIYVSTNPHTSDDSLTWVSDGVESRLTVTIPTSSPGYRNAIGAAYNAPDAVALIRYQGGTGTAGSLYFCIDFTGTYDWIEIGVPGPLVWGHIRRVHPNGDVITENVSDTHMSCDAGWYGGYKEALIKDAGQAERASSDLITGEWQGSTYRVTLADKDRRHRQYFASADDRFFTPAQSSDFYWTSRDNRAEKGVAFPIFNGPLITAKPVRPLGFELTFGDIIAATLLADENKVPWRRAVDGVFAYMDTPYEHFDPETPEPIVLGEHLRLPPIGTTPGDPASEQGLIFPPVYLGIMSGRHYWMTAGHACAAYIAIYITDGETITDVSADSPSVWAVPGWHSEPKYIDFRSKTYGKDRRYSLISAPVGSADAESCASGEKKLLVAVQGWETSGVGTDAVIVDAALQYMYWFVNHVANYGINCQHTVPLINPVWQTQDGQVPIVDVESFAKCSAIWALRYPIGAPRPTGGTYPAGAIGAAVIGMRGGNADRDFVKRWVADFNRGIGGRLTFTARGRAHLWMTNPTTDIKASALLFGDDLEILKDSFDADIRLPEMVNRQPWRTDYNHLTGSTITSGTASDDASVRGYRRDKTAEVLDLPFTPGSTQGNLRAQMLVYQRANPMKPLAFHANVGPDRDGKSAAKLECGDYFRYFAHAAISNSATEIRLAQVEKVRPLVGPRRVEIQAIDVEDLIGRFAYVPPPDPPAVGEEAQTCATATVLDPGMDPDPVSNVFSINTSANATDTSVAALLASKGVTAKRARWFSGVAPAGATKLFVTTYSSTYDTFLAILTGTCGALAWAAQDDGSDAYNDNDGDLVSSILEIPVTPGVTYFVLVGAVKDDDGPTLNIGAQFHN